MIKERKTNTERPTVPLSDPTSLSTAADEAEGKEEAAPREIPSARAWNKSPTKVEKAGDLESRGSRAMLSLSLRLRDEDAATVKYSPCAAELLPIRSPSALSPDEAPYSKSCREGDSSAVCEAYRLPGDCPDAVYFPRMWSWPRSLAY